MPSSNRIAFGSFTIDTVTRTPITLPRGCARMIVRNNDLTNDCTLYDASVGGSSMILTAGSEKLFVWPVFLGEANEIVCWATASSGTGPVVTEYYS